jgi:hypothetical protein
MEQLINNIVQQLLHQPSLQLVATEELLRITKTHPSFATAHFLLLKKMQQEEHPGFQQQLQKTNLYFNNPLWLQYLLTNNASSVITPKTPEAVLDTAANNEPVVITAANTTIEAPAAEAATIETPAEATIAAPVVPETIVTAAAPIPTPEQETDVKASPAITATPAITSAALDASALELELQPYHTIDYFAALGIKVGKLDENPQDNFGKQLKSFTEWLKAMKKGPKVDMDQPMGQLAEKKIVTDAEQSVQQKEIITEAMAEVLEKQGLHEIAIKVYQKLSLQNPSKSAYFAAKIEELKTK